MAQLGLEIWILRSKNDGFLQDREQVAELFFLVQDVRTQFQSREGFGLAICSAIKFG